MILQPGERSLVAKTVATRSVFGCGSRPPTPHTASGLREVALPFMQDLYDATHENVALAIRDGQEVVYIERILGSRAVHMLSRPGSRCPCTPPPWA